MLLLFLFIGPWSATASPHTASENALLIKDDSTKVVFANWLSEMEGYCVFLNENDNISMSVNILTKTNNVDAFPHLHYKYYFDGGVAGVSPRIEDTDLQPVVWLGQNLFLATFLYEIPYPEACEEPTDVVPISYRITLVTPNALGEYDEYPVADYIGTLFPDFTTLYPGSSEGAELTGQKSVCCRKQGGGNAGLERLNGESELENSIQVSPNPFTDWVDLKATFTENTSVQIQIFDAAGRRWYQAVEQVDKQTSFRQSISTTNFPPGIYFCTVTSDTGKEEMHVKLVKTE